jgi:hypothetical protein
MDTTLRPLSTSQLLDRTFFLYRKNFVLFAGVSAVTPALSLLLEIAFVPLGFPPQNPQAGSNPMAFFGLLLIYSLCGLLVFVLGHAFASGATMHAVSKVHLGQAVTITESYKKVLSRFGTVLLIVVATFSAVFGIVFAGYFVAVIVAAFAMPGIFRGGGGGGAIVLVVIAGIVALSLFGGAVFAGVYLYLKFCLAVPAAMAEGLKTGGAFKRAIFLSKGSMLRLFLIYLLTWVLGFVVGLVFVIPGQIVAAVAHQKAFFLALAVQYLGGFIGGVVVGPIAPIALSLVYYDQRVRKEAFDLQLMMQSIDQAAPAQAAIAAPPIG